MGSYVAHLSGWPHTFYVAEAGICLVDFLLFHLPSATSVGFGDKVLLYGLEWPQPLHPPVLVPRDLGLQAYTITPGLLLILIIWQ